ncbi:MAG TPA: tRNA uridine-5-carboxymethylaminomethyl(34) synthesis GTPase MnmE [Pseudomonadales bacterium]|nr:tRNA uridine-5-carboxymethylaminomethyl(34) synthesis GTPase MnmE [Pseudomonadales bacterium]
MKRSPTDSVGLETIVAVATPPGRGGVGIVRLSGARALEIGTAIAGRALEPRHAHHCLFRDAAGEALDDGLVLAFPGPASFTGEDVVELQGHGGPVVLERVVTACLAAGARLARPGEFSERAFLNDRLDLTQAEAIADLIDSASEAAARGALKTLQGAFSVRIEALMEAVTALRIYVEAAIDFPDEDVDFLADGDVLGRIDGLGTDVAAVIDDAGQGVLLTDGMTLVLAGPPNAGKSSLMNALARRDSAIVTEIPGTTRDVLRERIDVDGMPVHLVDTAGLRDTPDRIEAEGVRRARAEIGAADCLIYMVDAADAAAVPHSREDLAERVGVPLPPKVLIVRNKIDLVDEAPRLSLEPLPQLSMSLLAGTGLELLTGHLKQLMGFAGEQASPFTARTRHVDALRRARAALAEGRATLVGTGAGDLVAEDLRRAHDALGEIVGAVTPDDLLGRIFSSFCIGK